jgi:hypothetical protein
VTTPDSDKFHLIIKRWPSLLPNRKIYSINIKYVMDGTEELPLVTRALAHLRRAKDSKNSDTCRNPGESHLRFLMDFPLHIHKHRVVHVFVSSRVLFFKGMHLSEHHEEEI